MRTPAEIIAEIERMKHRQRKFWIGEGSQTHARFVRDVVEFYAVLGLCACGPFGWMMAGALIGGKR